MGFNFAGIVVNKNFENTISEIGRVFDWNLEFSETVDFETALMDRKDEESDYIDVYFSLKGTFIFVDPDCCFYPTIYPDMNILSFVIYETSMYYYMGYSENNIFLRSVTEINRDVTDEEGEKLEVEKESTSLWETLLKLMESTLGKSFWHIEPDEKVYRYKVKPVEDNLIENNISKDENLAVNGNTPYMDVYEELNRIADIRIQKGGMEAYYEVSKIVDEGSFIHENYRDFMKVYFEKQKIKNKTPKDAYIIVIIDVVGTIFNDEAFAYLDGIAFSDDLENQFFALHFLLTKARENKRKNVTIQKVNTYFDRYDEYTQMYINENFQDLFPYTSAINYREPIVINNLDNIEENQKKWWQFWK